MASKPKPKRSGIVVMLCVLLLAGALGYVYLRQLRHPPVVASEPHEDGACTVNGEPISLRELERTMLVAGGASIMRQLVEQKVIFQEAQREHLKLDDPSSVSALADLSAATKDPVVSQVLDASMRSRLLLKKIVLKQVPESLKHHIYETFKDALVQYEVFAIMVRTQRDAASVQAALRRGDPFGTVAAKWSFESRSKRGGGRIGVTDIFQVTKALGAPAAATVVALKPGVVSAPVPTRWGFVILQVGQVRSTYDELSGSIDTVLFRARRSDILHQLTERAHISSPLWDLYGREPGPKAEPSSLFNEPSSVPSAEASGSNIFAEPTFVPKKKGQADSVFAAPSATAPSEDR